MSHRIRVATIAIAASLAALSWSQSSVAAPIVSVDMDPTTAGIQSSLTVQQGSSFSVDIFISGVEATAPLNGFELMLTDSAGLATAQNRTLGPFLPAPPAAILPPIELPFSPGSDVLIGGNAIGLVGGIGSGVLATVDFIANSAGTTSLALSSVQLTAVLGLPILGATAEDGSLTIESGPSQLPAPPALALLLLGGLATWVAARRRSNEQLS